MKTKLLFTAILALMLQLNVSNKASAQILGVNINYAGDYDSLSGYCSAPATLYFYISGTAGGYVTGDSIEIHVNFGDGADTTFKTDIYVPQNYFYAYTPHTYNAPGMYSVQYIATGPDGLADTMVVADEVIIADSCGAISGMVYIDDNGNCIFDTGDTPLPYYSITVSHGSQVVAYAYTDSLGNYSYNVPYGYTYTVQVNPTNIYGQSFNVTCPVSGSYTVTTIPTANLDFALDCLQGYDLTGYLSGWGFRPGFDATIWFDVWNIRCLPVNGQAKLVLDPTLTYISSNPAPTTISGDTLIYNISNIQNGYWNYPYFYISVHTPITANIGDTVCMQLIIEPIAGDSVPGNNIIDGCYPVQNSWDPNMKEVSPTGEGATGDILNNIPMTYTVHFQNTGTAVAYDIFILDTLDSNLNPATLEIIGSSHPMTFNMMAGDIMKFTFNNIMLPDSGSNQQGSHGYVIYRISQDADLPIGTEITNTAGIYFDFNPAIITNTTLNTIDYATGIASYIEPAVKVAVYPNPANKYINFSVPVAGNISDMKIYNSSGVEIYSRKDISGNKFSLNTSALNAGIYHVNLYSGNLVYSAQFVIVH